MTAALTAVVTERLRAFNGLSPGRQIALLGMIAGGLVVAVAVLYWALRPTYAPLFAQMDGAEAAEVLEALTKLGVPYHVDERSGRIEIPQQQIAETRLLLAGQGLPKSNDLGFELLQQETGFGASRLMEGARFQRALEGELGRSIAALEPVERARVHIAQPERSVFVRDRTPATASVVLQLRGNKTLTEAQVAAIVHLVSSSIPGLEPGRVMVVDQRGRLLTGNEDESGKDLNTDHLDYARRVEASYVERVEDLLTPIVGRNRARVQVVADLDFSKVERTQESYDPDRTAVRSEQVNEEERVGSEPGPMGIPGALTNQPPQGGTVGAGGDQPKPVVPTNRSLQTTRNYEVDRTISHIQEVPGTIRRLSTAVVVDYRDQVSESGEVTRVQRSDAELESLRALVREAVGFNSQRNDSLNVVSISFTPDTPEDDGIPFWSETWFLELAKIGAGLILAALILLTVVRPALKQFMPKPEVVTPEEETQALTDESQAGEEGEEMVALTQEGAAIAALAGPKGPDQQQMDLDAIREMVRDDPKRVVQVMKAWLAEDGD